MLLLFLALPTMFVFLVSLVLLSIFLVLVHNPTLFVCSRATRAHRLEFLFRLAPHVPTIARTILCEECVTQPLQHAHGKIICFVFVFLFSFFPPVLLLIVFPIVASIWTICLTEKLILPLSSILIKHTYLLSMWYVTIFFFLFHSLLFSQLPATTTGLSVNLSSSALGVALLLGDEPQPPQIGSYRRAAFTNGTNISAVLESGWQLPLNSGQLSTSFLTLSLFSCFFFFFQVLGCRCCSWSSFVSFQLWNFFEAISRLSQRMFR